MTFQFKDRFSQWVHVVCGPTVFVRLLRGGHLPSLPLLQTEHQICSGPQPLSTQILIQQMPSKNLFSAICCAIIQSYSRDMHSTEQIEALQVVNTARNLRNRSSRAQKQIRWALIN
jgi:hypothetical protein